MLVNALIGAVSTLVLFFLQRKAATHRHEQRAAWTCPLRDGTRRGAGIADDGALLAQAPRPRDSAVWHDRCTVSPLLLSALPDCRPLWSSADLFDPFPMIFLALEPIFCSMTLSRPAAGNADVGELICLFYDYDCPFHRVWMDHVIVKNLLQFQTLISFFADERFFQKMINTAAPCQSAVRVCALSPPHSPPLFLSSTTSRHRHIRGTSLSRSVFHAAFPDTAFL